MFVYIFSQLPGEKVLGLAKFFLGVGIPGSAQDFFHQIDALGCLENIRQVFWTFTFFSFHLIQLKYIYIYIYSSFSD